MLILVHLPILQYLLSGAVLPNGTVVSFTGALTRAPGENVGAYAIQQGTLANSNYNITFVSS